MQVMLAEETRDLNTVNYPCQAEPKLDGRRILIEIRDSNVKVFSRQGEDITDQNAHNQAVASFLGVPEQELEGRLSSFIQEIGIHRSLTVDAEAYATDSENRPIDFYTYLSIIKGNKEKAAKYQPHILAFDLLELDGHDLRSKPFLKRRELLARNLPNNHIISIPPLHIVNNATEAETAFQDFLSQGAEGVMLKQPFAAYQSNRRTTAWLKFKLSRELDGVVMGFTVSEKTEGVAALLIGLYQDGKYQCVGKVNLPIQRKEWLEKLIPEHNEFQLAIRNDIPAEEVKPGGLYWIKPKYVVTIQYQNKITAKDKIYDSGYALRFPRLIRFRDDKRKEECLLSQI